jgi:hypothetical protein
VAEDHAAGVIMSINPIDPYTLNKRRRMSLQDEVNHRAGKNLIVSTGPKVELHGFDYITNGRDATLTITTEELHADDAAAKLLARILLLL